MICREAFNERRVLRPIDVFITYDGKRAADIPVPRYATRHLVAAEVCGRQVVMAAYWT